MYGLLNQRSPEVEQPENNWWENTDNNKFKNWTSENSHHKGEYTYALIAFNGRLYTKDG